MSEEKGNEPRPQSGANDRMEGFLGKIGKYLFRNDQTRATEVWCESCQSMQTKNTRNIVVIENHGGVIYSQNLSGEKIMTSYDWAMAFVCHSEVNDLNILNISLIDEEDAESLLRQLD